MTGPQQQAPDRSGHDRTATASARSQWPRPGLNWKCWIAAGTARPQPQVLDRSGHRRTSPDICDATTDRMPAFMPGSMPEFMLDRVPGQPPRQIESQNTQIGCQYMPDRIQSICQIEYQSYARYTAKMYARTRANKDVRTQPRTSPSFYDR